MRAKSCFRFFTLIITGFQTGGIRRLLPVRWARLDQLDCLVVAEERKGLRGQRLRIPSMPCTSLQRSQWQMGYKKLDIQRSGGQGCSQRRFGRGWRGSYLLCAHAQYWINRKHFMTPMHMWTDQALTNFQRRAEEKYKKICLLSSLAIY